MSNEFQVNKDEEMKKFKQNISHAILHAKRLISSLSVICPASVHDVKYRSPLQTIKVLALVVMKKIIYRINFSNFSQVSPKLALIIYLKMV